MKLSKQLLIRSLFIVEPFWYLQMKMKNQQEVKKNINKATQLIIKIIIYKKCIYCMRIMVFIDVKKHNKR